MRVVYVGNYTAPWCTEVHLARELESLGHDVCRIQEPPGGGDRDLLRLIECESDGADLFLWTRTWGLPASATRLWRRLEENGCATASYHLDLYVPLARGQEIETDPFWTTGTVFTPDGNPASEAFFAERGINHVWSPPAVVSDECTLGTPRPEYAHDVVFVGSAEGYHSEWPWRADLVRWLEHTYRDRFVRYGHPRVVRGQDLSDLYASAKVVVGDSCFAAPGQRYFSDRPFESYGRGAYMIFPRIDLLAEMIGPYPAYTVGDFDELRDAIDSALGDAYHRDGTRDRLHEKVRTEHTYKIRLRTALDVMGLT